jgi:hypothetical protein
MFVGRDRLEAYPRTRHGTCHAPKRRVPALVFLVLGLFCAVVSRILLVTAALSVSGWWVLGVLLPFGPLFFRLNYPDLARSPAMLRLATVPCLFLYFVLGPGASYKERFSKAARPGFTQPVHYGFEASRSKAKKSNAPGPVVDVGADIEQRSLANFREFQRLNAWGEALKLRKRDLLHSDAEGNRAYEIELAQYNAALAKANAERSALAALAK